MIIKFKGHANHPVMVLNTMALRPNGTNSTVALVLLVVIDEHGLEQEMFA